MGSLTCMKCGSVWDGARHPKCPQCEFHLWSNLPTLVTPKHDPIHLPSAYPAYRSVVPLDFSARKQQYLRVLSESGTALYFPRHKKYTKVVTVPSGYAGSGIPSGSAMPTHCLDSFEMADTEGDPHIYPQDGSRIRDEINVHDLQRLPRCSVAGCNNFAFPNDDKCAKHKSPPLAY
jgi:hypothetical protein